MVCGLPSRLCHRLDTSKYSQILLTVPHYGLGPIRETLCLTLRRAFSSGSSPDIYTPDSGLLSAKELIRNLDTITLGAGMASSEVVERYLRRANALITENKLASRDFFQILYALTRLDTSILVHNSDSQSPVTSELDSLLLSLQNKLKRSTRFITTVTHIDIAVGLTSLTKLRGISNGSLVGSIARSLYNEIPSRISVFDDHHFGQILNSMWRLDVQDHVIAHEIISELISNRDVSHFNGQSIVVLATSLSRLSLDPSPDLDVLWNSILLGSIRIDAAKMQQNWPIVLLESFSFSKTQSIPAQSEFVSKMIPLILKSRDTNERTIVKIIESLKRIGVSEQDALRKVSTYIKRKTA